METFVDAMPFTDHPTYAEDRAKALRELDQMIRTGEIDPPLIELLAEFARIPHCFTLQSCWGHFVHEKQPDTLNTAPLAPYRAEIREVYYRIAYLAVCIRDTDPGRRLFADLNNLVTIDPGYIQFGSAAWFWSRIVNSYVVQVVPERFRNRDIVEIGIEEALHIERLRDYFFAELRKIAKNHRNE
jgi:hypothetical protein